MTTTTTRELQYRQAINEALRQEMERDENVIIMGEEIAGGAGREHHVPGYARSRRVHRHARSRRPGHRLGCSSGRR